MSSPSDADERAFLDSPPAEKALESDPFGIPINGSASPNMKRTRITAAMTFQGPLPPPHLMQAYNAIVPNGAERIFAVFEKQVDHRQDLERTVVRGNNRRADRGFWAALYLASLVIGGGFWLAYLGKSLSGLSAIFLALVGLLTAFINGRTKQTAELATKAEQLKGVTEDHSD